MDSTGIGNTVVRVRNTAVYQRIMPAAMAALVVLVSLNACSVGAVRDADIGPSQVWGAAENVTRVGNLYFSEQPDQAGILAARQQGVTTVINLRDPSELDWDEETAVEDAGLRYINIPIDGRSTTLDSTVMQQISAAVESLGNTTVLLHCSSGNRAAAWYATHLVETRGMRQADAINIAEQVGLTADGMKTRLNNYFDEQSE